MTSLDAVMVDAKRLSADRVSTITWPAAGDDPRWAVVAGRQTMTVGDRGGAVTLAPTRRRGGTGFAGTMRRLHDGDDMGPIWQTIIFVAGLFPAALATTGIIMWWRARRWKAALADRRRR